MGYIRAEEILPNEIIELIQQYIDGTNIYIPRKPQHRQEWGTRTAYKRELWPRTPLCAPSCARTTSSTPW